MPHKQGTDKFKGTAKQYDAAAKKEMTPAPKPKPKKKK